MFGELALVPSDNSIPVTRMPIALRAGPPEIDVTPTALSAVVAAGGSVTRNLSISNVGNPAINWDIDNTGTAPFPLHTQLYDGIRGNASDFFTGTNGGFYQVEDLVSADPASLRNIEVAGFMTGTGGTLQATATAITVKVYSDNAGQPAGNPDGGSAGEIYSCVRTPSGPNSTGVTFRTTDGAAFGINLDLAATAGCPAPPALAANTRYWVTVYPTVPGTTTSRRWILGRATSSNGLPPMSFTSLTIAGGTATWTALAPVAGPPPSIAALAMSFTTNVNCNAPWLSASPTAGSLGLTESDPTVVTANAASLTAGNYRGIVCVDSNGADADEPKVAVPFALEVAPAGDLIFENGFE